MDTGGERTLDNLYDLLTSQQEEIENLKAAKDRSTVEADTTATEDENENSTVKTNAFKNWFLKTISFDPAKPNGGDSSSANPNPEASTSAAPATPLVKSIQKSVEKTSSVDQTDPTTDAIPQICVEMLNCWFRTIHPGNKVQEKLKTVKHAENADILKRVVINDEIRKRMERPELVADQRMKWLSNAILKCAQPLSSAWAKLLNLQHIIQERSIPEGEPQSDELPDGMVPLKGDDKLNLSAVIRDMQLGLEILGMANVQAVQKHHLDLKYKLNGAAKELARINQPFDDTLFGPNLKQHFNTILNVNRITTKVSRGSSSHHYHPFLGGNRRRRHRGRSGFHGYSQGNQNWSPSRITAKTTASIKAALTVTTTT